MVAILSRPQYANLFIANIHVSVHLLNFCAERVSENVFSCSTSRGSSLNTHECTPEVQGNEDERQQLQHDWDSDLEVSVNNDKKTQQWLENKVSYVLLQSIQIMFSPPILFLSQIGRNKVYNKIS